MSNRNIHNTNYVCKRINDLMQMKKLQCEDVVKIIDKESSEELKEICSITIERMKEITDNIPPTLLECILIGQALGKGIGYFYYNGYQIY